jgi:hypothetical protein
LLVVCTGLSGCFGRHQSADAQSADVIEDFDQQQYATTSPVGDGSETSSGYFGASGGSTDPEHRPASPTLGGNGRAVQRRPAQPSAEPGGARHEPY